MESKAKNRFESNWSFCIIKSLLTLGVDKFCLAPGGRPTAIINALDHFEINPIKHFDERGIGFYALGSGKLTGKPVVVITTSGTALGNLMPAVMEAYHSREPLIVLSTDLSWEDSGSGKNQACKQQNIFSDYTQYSFDFPCVENEFNFNALHSNLRHAVTKSFSGPVHLNFRFKSPFINNIELLEKEMETEKVYPIKFYPEEKEIQDFCNELHTYKSGVVVIGQLPVSLDQTEIIDLCEHLKWPVLADPLSGLRGKFFNKFPVYLVNEYQNKELKPDCVLFLGGDILLRLPDAPFSRCVHKYLDADDCKKILVSDNPNRQDPFLNYDKRIFSSLGVFSKLVKQKLLATKKSSLYEKFQELEDRYNNIDKQEADIPESVFSEFSCMKFLVSKLENKKLFIGNSLAIRQLDCVLNTDLKVGSAHGLKGIDGNLALAAGFEAEIVVLGDTAFLHDLNSLSLFIERKSIIIVFNNNGGHIFNYVEAKNTKNFEQNFINPHSMSFDNSAKQFGLDYHQAINLKEFEEAFQNANSSLKTSIIEVVSSSEDLQKSLTDYFRV